MVSPLFYLLPSIIGWKKRNAKALIVLNLFLGWTVIGWVGALVWALCAKAQILPIPAAALPEETRASALGGKKLPSVFHNLEEFAGKEVSGGGVAIPVESPDHNSVFDRGRRSDRSISGLC